ncbi:MAG: GNAT family N-acetyltransferase [Deltaproteobacteria bacterium]|nr:GNAT family N-acetyltransferase [Deltaproteobacteria bacterium]
MAEKHPAKTRKFKAEDINQILEIEKQAFPKTVFSKATLLEYADSLPDTFIVVQIGKNIVGYIIFDLTGHIHSTVVKKSYRRKGFGKLLFVNALRSVKKNLWLEVRSRNLEAIEFYKRLGMKIVGEIPNYYVDDHALIMRLENAIPP